MALLDDLKGILSPEDFAKIQANAAVATRIAKGDELYGYYVGDEPPAVTPPAVVIPPAAVVPPVTPPGMFDLGAIERVFDARLSKLDERIDAKLGEFATSRGSEFVNNAVKIAVQRADELNRIYHRHSELTGKPFDSADFNTFLEKPEVKAKGYRTLNDAYEAYAAPTIQEQTIAAEVDKRVKATSGTVGVPGTTSAPATNNNIRFFQKRGTAAEGGGQTAAQRAAEALDRRAASRQAEAS